MIWKIAINEFNISSRSAFSLSSDKRFLLFDADLDRKEPDDINQVVNILEVATGKITTVTPPTVEAREPRWFGSDNKILFTCLKRHEEPFRPHLCTINADGTGLTTLVRDAQNASVAR